MAGPARLRRDAGVIGLLYASLGSIIGSGWLFGALHAAVQAGPWSVLFWVIGAVAILYPRVRIRRAVVQSRGPLAHAGGWTGRPTVQRCADRVKTLGSSGVERAARRRSSKASA